MNIAKKFIELTSKTMPSGSINNFQDIANIPLSMDKYGNYYFIVPGDDTTMFTSHIDTYGEQLCDTGVNLYKDEHGVIFARSSNESILGADCKGGVTVMLYMIHNNIPGIYYFFIDEEIGLLGSRHVSSNYNTLKHLHDAKKVVTFDRSGCNSIITKQAGYECCSQVFVNKLTSAFNDAGVDFIESESDNLSDSAMFVNVIDDCVNISTGYFDCHTNNERQNMTFLYDLCKACINIKWCEL